MSLQPIRVSFAIMILFCPVGSAVAQDSPFDPANDEGLRLWLRADDLVTAGLQDGDPVSQWLDVSLYETIMAPRETTRTPGAVNTNEAFWGNPVDEAPHLQIVDINGKQVPSVRFDRDFGPNGRVCHPLQTTGPNCASVEGQTSIGVDRLYQQNNLEDPENDPTNIYDGTDLTAFVVWSQDIVDETITVDFGDGPVETSPTDVQVIVGKRGSAASAWEFGTETRGDQVQDRGELITVTYGGSVVWESDFIPPSNTWQIAAMTIEEADPDDPGIPDIVTWYHTTGGDAMQFVGETEIVARGSVENEPFGIGAHAQQCCGELESFIGNIGEVILMDRILAPEDQEWGRIESYLQDKFFSGGVAIDCDFDGNGSLGVGDVDMLLAEVKAGTNNAELDVTGDGVVDVADVNFFVEDSAKLNTWVGDANLDGEFNSSDLVTLFQAGEYEDNVAMNSTWATGDFTGDGEFDTGDLVAAFQGGGFEAGPRAAVAAVPEPSCLSLLLLGGFLTLRRRK